MTEEDLVAEKALFSTSSSSSSPPVREGHGNPEQELCVAGPYQVDPLEESVKTSASIAGLTIGMSSSAPAPDTNGPASWDRGAVMVMVMAWAAVIVPLVYGVVKTTQQTVLLFH
jgi:hypothetical protein